MPKGLVCVFGADGFLGHYVIGRLARKGWRVRACVRRPHSAGELRVMGQVGQIQIMQANIRNEASVIRAVQDCDAVVNLVGILYEKGKQKFQSVHVKGIKNIAEAAKAEGIENIVHISAMGADENAKSKYARSKALGERELLAQIPKADILRPSILFGADDGFFTRFAKMASFSPILPLPGGGKTKFQPVYVADIADAIVKILANGSNGQIYELGGAKTYSYKELMQFILNTIDKKRMLLPLPWGFMSFLGAIGSASSFIPFVKPFITSDQVKSLRNDNIASGKYPGLADIGIIPETIEAIMPEALASFRKYGQFYEPANS